MNLSNGLPYPLNRLIFPITSLMPYLINCLDHVADFNLAVERISQILEPGGPLFISVHVKTKLYWLLRSILPDKIFEDPHHPHPLSMSRLAQTLRHNGLFIIRAETWWPKPMPLRTRLFESNVLVWASKPKGHTSGINGFNHL